MLRFVQILTLTGQALALVIPDPNLRLAVGGIAVALTGMLILIVEIEK